MTIRASQSDLLSDFKKKLHKKSKIHPTRQNSYFQAFLNMLHYQSLKPLLRKKFLDETLTLNFNLETLSVGIKHHTIIDHKNRSHLILFFNDWKMPHTQKEEIMPHKISSFQQIETAFLTLSMIFFGPERKIEKFNKNLASIELIDMPLKNGGIEFNSSQEQNYVIVVEKISSETIKIVGCTLIIDRGFDNDLDLGIQICRLVSIKPGAGVSSALQIAALIRYPERRFFLHSRYAKKDSIYSAMDRRYVYSNFFKEVGKCFEYQGMKNIKMESEPNDIIRKKLTKKNSHFISH